jgi:hypothetical protein
MVAGSKVELAAAPVNFIGAWYLENLGICDDLLRLYREAPNKVRGIFSNNKGVRILDPEEKDDIELTLRPDCQAPEFRTYVAELQKVLVKYTAEFPWCNAFAPWTIVEPMNIQFYPPGGGYKAFHTERVSATLPNVTRHLVFMTYLNDVYDAGGTEFIHQRLVVSARKGLTLIWPVDWTHTHRGIVSLTEEKYVITGWLNYY